MNDQLWMTIRYLMIAGGGYLAGRGYLRNEDVSPIVDAVLTLAPFVISLAGAAWGYMVRHNTVLVPKPEVLPGQPVVNPLTGSAKPSNGS